MANSNLSSSMNQNMAHMGGGSLVNGYYKQVPYSGGRSRNTSGRSGSRGRGKPAVRVSIIIIIIIVTIATLLRF